ncbi:hypothetical protein M3Y98_00375300 [Aphelenchoides besseyi]|nr:hypothetical protein M3Y98_00375300 [Aphelenchoides besseyi]
MKLWVVLIAFFAVVSIVAAYPSQSDLDAEVARQLISRAYHALSKTKRSPSMGLSLAEWMAAGPQGQDTLHFIPSGRK